MSADKYFKEMYANIWQGNDLNKFDDYYTKDFVGYGVLIKQIKLIVSG